MKRDNRSILEVKRGREREGFRRTKKGEGGTGDGEEGEKDPYPSP